MADVCQKLEQVVKRNLAPNSRCSINIQKIITGWDKIIKEDFELKNIHMIHKNNETGLQMLKNGMQSIVNIIKDAKSAIDDSVEHFSITSDQYEHVQQMCDNIVNMFKKIFKSQLITERTQNDEEEIHDDSDNEEGEEEEDEEEETDEQDTSLEEEEEGKEVDTQKEKRGTKRSLKPIENNKEKRNSQKKMMYHLYEPKQSVQILIQV